MEIRDRLFMAKPQPAQNAAAQHRNDHLFDLHPTNSAPLTAEQT